jgi:predicted HAD superfamily hydrolase
VRSFDFFDTLVTRLVAKPVDVFRLVERRLELPGWARARIQAELLLRRSQPGREVCLAQILAAMSPTPENARRARDVELTLELALSAPVRANLGRLHSGDLIVSDTYLPRCALSSILAHWAPGVQPTWRISSEVGIRKAEGGLWDHVVSESLPIEWHIGDNEVSDVREPRRRGIKGDRFVGAQLNRFEKALYDGTVVGSLAAGSARAARLASEELGERCADTMLSAVLASAVAPALTSFVDWVLERCMEERITRALFLARDGQLLHRIAQRRILARGLPVEAVYVYGSRHALHLAGYTDVEAAESWLLENTPTLTLRDLAARADVEPSLVGTLGRERGLISLDANLSLHQRRQLPPLIRDSRFVDAFRERSSPRWAAARSYYEVDGLAGHRHVALVDVGWTGRMQASLRQILAKGSNAGIRVSGFYFCLSRKVRTSDLDQLHGYSHDPDDASGPNRFDGFRAMVEAFLEADHGKTLGFELTERGAIATLADSPGSSHMAVVRMQQKAVMNYVEALGCAESVLGEVITIPRERVLRNLLRLLCFPRPEEATAFAAREHAEGQVETRREALVRKVRFGPSLLQRPNLGFWPEGTVAYSGFRLLVVLLNAVREWRLRSP